MIYICLISCSIYNKSHEGKWNPSKKITISRRGFPITKPIIVGRTFKGKDTIKYDYDEFRLNWFMLNNNGDLWMHIRPVPHVYQTN